MTTTADDVWKLLAELAEAQKETERILKEQSLKTDRQITRLSQEIGKIVIFPYIKLVKESENVSTVKP